MKKKSALLAALAMLLSSCVLPVSAKENERVYENLRYLNCGDYVQILGFAVDETAEYLEIPAEIEGLPVTEIKSEAFDFCDELISVTIPDSVTSIGTNAFFNCKSLTDVTLPDRLDSIGGFAFGGCSALTAITIPEGITDFGDYAFAGCINLADITIPDGMTNFGGKAFRNTPWQNALFGDSAFAVYDHILLDTDRELCTGTVTVPDDVTMIGKLAFMGCGEMTEAIIPDGVTVIGESAFWGCGGMTSVTIPDSVESIGESAFFTCEALTSVTIPEHVTSIGNHTFFGCTELGTVDFPEELTYIGNYAFALCERLTDVIIPARVEQIDLYAFAACTDLNAITIENPDCEIYRHDGTISNGYVRSDDDTYDIFYYNGTIYGYEDSGAQKYAERYDYRFESLGDAPTEPSAPLYGDTDCNGEVALLDVVLLNKHLMLNEKITDQGKVNADVNLDGDLNPVDSLNILKYLIKLAELPVK